MEHYETIKRVRITLEVSDKFRRALKAQSSAEGLTMKEYIMRLVACDQYTPEQTPLKQAAEEEY